MTATETMGSRGFVEPSFIDIRTGKRMPWHGRHNTLSYDAAHAMALAFGSDDSLVPNRIGIVYGVENDTEFATIDRYQPWDSFVHELQDVGADVQIQPFSYSPSFTQVTKGGVSSGDSSDDSGSGQEAQQGWAVTFHAHSDSVTPGALGTAGGSSSSGMIFTSGMYIFQAVLLNESGSKRTVLARVSLDNAGVYYAKPENFEIALDWTVKFF